MTHQLIQDMFSGPIDVVGDIHGEIDALRDLLTQLGYDPSGRHPHGRRLVFIGDLTDRGPDSPGVLDWVMGLVSHGLAQCVLGNHELNLLRNAPKEGNGWYFEENHDVRKGKFGACRAVDSARLPAVRAFLSAQPLALERADLRVVHAAWHGPSMQILRSSHKAALDLYAEYHHRSLVLGKDTGLEDRAAVEEKEAGPSLFDENAKVPLLLAVGAQDALYQDSNPVRIVTSGLERIAREPFFASGKWRMVDRYKWWQDYQEEIPVIVGHYWRWPSVAARDAYSRGEPDLFQGYAQNQWFGAKENVFCTDFSVGARFKERAGGPKDHFQCRLGAVRWPERELVMDDGTRTGMVD